VEDKIGKEIRVGDLIVYGHALGRCAGLRIGEVLEIKDSKLVVQGVDAEWRENPRLLSKRSTLSYPDRCAVVDWGDCRPEIRQVLIEAAEKRKN
jgi:ribonuclease HI